MTAATAKAHRSASALRGALSRGLAASGWTRARTDSRGATVWAYDDLYELRVSSHNLTAGVGFLTFMVRVPGGEWITCGRADTMEDVRHAVDYAVPEAHRRVSSHW